MSDVLTLARRYLEVSRGTDPRSVPVGQSLKAPKGHDTPVPFGHAVPLGHLRDSGTDGTFGTLGTDGPANEDGLFDERAAIVEFDGGLPRDHAEGLAALHAAPLPEGVTEEQRGLVINAAARFLDKQQRPRVLR